MSSVTRCYSCHGRKIIMGIGMIDKECPVCFGVGWIADEKPEIKKTEVVEKKKRGPKPTVLVNND